jgi:hypothetical protein
MLRIKSMIYLTGQANINDRNSKFKTDGITARYPKYLKYLGHWNFDIICNLSIGIWDFSAVFWEANGSI